MVPNGERRTTVRVLGYSWVGIVTGDFAGTLRFFTETLGLPLARREDEAGFAHLRLPSGQLFEVFGANSEYADVHGDSSPVVGFEVEDVRAAQEDLSRQGVEFITEVQEDEEGACWVYFRGPEGRLYELQSPSKNLT
jgi:catechol 2,3-dioxygenase-like lactoylglutathione lyase family enzyme